MGSVGILYQDRCDCGGFVWTRTPHSMSKHISIYDLCASCAAVKLRNTVPFERAVSRTFAKTVMPHITNEQKAAAEMRSFLYPSCRAASLWWRGYLRHHLLPHGHLKHSYFHKLTFCHNGEKGSIDDHTDIIDKILVFIWMIYMKYEICVLSMSWDLFHGRLDNHGAPLVIRSSFCLSSSRLVRNGCLRTTVLHLINCKHNFPAQRRIPNDFCN